MADSRPPPDHQVFLELTKMFEDFRDSSGNSAAEIQSSAAPASTVRKEAEARLPTEFGTFRLIGYRSLTSDEEFVVLVRGELDPGMPTLVRIHSQCLTGDVFGSTKCDCGQQLKAAMALIWKENRGVIIYQQQEGRGIGIMNKIRAYGLQDRGADTIGANELLGLAPDLRRYDQCAEILRDLGLSQIRIISNNPEKIRALEGGGLEIVERVPLKIKFHQSLIRYLKTKREEMGHILELPGDLYEKNSRRGEVVGN